MIQILNLLTAEGPLTSAALTALQPAHRRPTLECGMLWLLKHCFVTLLRGKPTPLG